MNVIARLTSTPTASSRVTSFTLHDPSDKPVTGQQSRPLLGPTPLHIPRLLVPRNLSEPTSSNRTFMIHAFYKSELLRRTETECRCPAVAVKCHCLRPPVTVVAHSNMNVIARLTSTPTASSRVTSFTLHDPSDKPVTGQQSRPLLGPTPLHIPRLLVPRNLSEPTSSNRTFMIHAFYKSELLRRTETECRCPAVAVKCHCLLPPVTVVSLPAPAAFFH